MPPRTKTPAVPHTISLPHDLNAHFLELAARHNHGTHGAKSQVVQSALALYYLACKLAEQKGFDGNVVRMGARAVRLYLSRDEGG